MSVESTLSRAQRSVIDRLRELDLGQRESGRRDELSVRAVSPEVARLLYLLVVSGRAKRIVEFGTSHGLSTIYLAAAAERTGGHVHTVDESLEKTAIARRNLAECDLGQRVTLATMQGAEFAAELPSDVDFVLVDYGVDRFSPAFDALRDRVAPGCLLFFDGGPRGYWALGGIREFRERLETDPDFVTAFVPMAKKHFLAVRLG